MTRLLSEIEELPDSYPEVTGLTPPAAALEDVAWQRVEAYVRCRWTPRRVMWIVEGPGPWSPPLEPAALEETEEWSRAGEWGAAEAVGAPMGVFLRSTGPWRFEAEVGGGSPAPVVPVAVLEAVRRLAEYLAVEAKPGVTSEQASVGALTYAIRRDASWQAKALQNSGAADLLRPWKRLKTSC